MSNENKSQIADFHFAES